MKPASSLIMFLLFVSGCANSRRIALESQAINLREATHFHIHLNRKSEKVNYDPAAFFMGYENYAGGRARVKSKPDVPDEIAKYLVAKRKTVTLGGDGSEPGGDTIIIRYQELWGWDMGDILKQLRIRAYRGNDPANETRVAFNELTFFNSHPTARNLVPKMMDSLYYSGLEGPREQAYEYAAAGWNYKTKVVKGILSDTSYILSQDGDMVEKSYWVSRDSTPHRTFKQAYIFTRLDTSKYSEDPDTRPVGSVMKTLRKETPALRFAYDKHLKLRPGFKGKVTLRLWIRPDGAVDKIMILGDTTRNKAFAIAVLEKVSVWRFATITGDKVAVVTVPFTFSE